MERYLHDKNVVFSPQASSRKDPEIKALTTVQAAKFVGRDLSILKSQRASWQRRPEDFDDFRLDRRNESVRKDQLKNIHERIHQDWSINRLIEKE